MKDWPKEKHLSLLIVKKKVTMINWRLRKRSNLVTTMMIMMVIATQTMMEKMMALGIQPMTKQLLLKFRYSNINYCRTYLNP